MHIFNIAYLTQSYLSELDPPSLPPSLKLRWTRKLRRVFAPCTNNDLVRGLTSEKEYLILNLMGEFSEFHIWEGVSLI